MKAFSDEIYLLIIFAGFIQGLLLLFGISRSKSSNSKSNIFLKIFIIIVTLTLLARITSIKEIFIQFPHVGYTADLLILLYAPILFLYVHTLLAKKLPSYLWLHFIPSIIQFILWLPYYFISSNEIIKKLASGEFAYFPWFQVVAIIQIYLYSFFTIKKIKEYKKLESKHLSFYQGINYLFIIISLITLANTAWLIGWISLISDSLPYFIIIGYNSIWLFLTFIVYTIGFIAIKKPELITFDFETEKYEQSKIGDDRLKEIKLKIEKKMINEKLYLSPKLTIGEFADEINENVKNVSRVINEQYGMNFFDFVNSYRIEEFINHTKEKKHKEVTLLSLAYDSGFNSKTTFNSAFKKLKNTTPSAFVNKN